MRSGRLIEALRAWGYLRCREWVLKKADLAVPRDATERGTHIKQRITEREEECEGKRL
jgi:hypothetical protein